MYIIIMYLYFISLLETFYANKVIQKENVHYTTKIKLYPLKMKLDYITLVIQKLTYVQRSVWLDFVQTPDAFN